MTKLQRNASVSTDMSSAVSQSSPVNPGFLKRTSSGSFDEKLLIQSTYKKPRTSKDAVAAYAVQCGKCSKWRLIPSKEEYETIRETFIEDPWFCDKNPKVSCDDPGDIEYDTSRLWVIDKPNIPKTPPNAERHLSLRKNLSKMDATYTMPNGKRVRSTVEVEKFLEMHPEYKDEFSVSDFSFTVPKIPEDMVPRTAAGSNKKNMTQEEE